MRLITPQTIFTYTKVKKIIPNFLVRSVMYSFIYRIYVCVWLKYQLIFIIIKLKKNQLSTHFYCISVCLCFYIKRQNWKHQVSNCIKMYSAHFCMIFFLLAILPNSPAARNTGLFSECHVTCEEGHVAFSLPNPRSFYWSLSLFHCWQPDGSLHVGY